MMREVLSAAVRHTRVLTSGLRSGIPLVIICLASTACGVASSARTSSRAASATFAPCPGEVHAIRPLPTSDKRVRKLLPLDPIAGELCVYSDGTNPSRAELQTAMRLRAPRARTLTLLVDSPDHGSSCDGAFPVLIRLSYRGGKVLSALAAGCDPELLSTSAGVQTLPPTASLITGGDVLPPPKHPGRVKLAIDYTGQRLAAAVRAAKRQFRPAGGFHARLYELDDPGAPFEEVVWQNPLPGTGQDTRSGELGLVIATHHAPPCRADQLLGRYANGGNGTGDHFGNIDLLDTSPQACSLSGHITLHGVGTDGRPDTNTVSEAVGPALVLSPDTTLRTLQHDPASALIVTFDFGGDARDDPQAPNGLCYDHETIPRAWSLKLSTGATLHITNGAPGEGGPFYSCHGNVSFRLSAGVRLLGS